MTKDHISDIGFTPSVKAQQERLGSREGYRRLMDKRDWKNSVTDELQAFLAQRDSFYIASATSDGQPYIQHRGGPPGFLKIIDDRTLGFADFSGNRQYISIGNFAQNEKAFIFLMDYENSGRVKMWGTVEVVEDDDALLRKLTMPDYKGRVERAFIFSLKAWDSNCPQHIPKKYALETVETMTARLFTRIAELEAQVAKLQTEK